MKFEKTTYFLDVCPGCKNFKQIKEGDCVCEKCKVGKK